MLKSLQVIVERFNVPFISKYEELIFKFSLMLLVLDGSAGWNLNIITRITCTLLLVFDQFAKNKIFWLLLSVLLLVFNSLQWYNIDNHKILFMYWVLLLTTYLWTEKSIEYISSNSKILIGLIMLFAVLQKVINEFMAPGFLHGRFLFDSRFMLVTHFITDIPVDELYKNRNALQTLNLLPIDQSFVRFTSTKVLGNAVYVFQIFGLIVESLVAALFLFGKKSSLFKDYALIIFCLGTYFMFPVIGFSSILLLLGITQSSLKVRNYYILAFIIIQFSQIPWQKLLYYFENTI